MKLMSPCIVCGSSQAKLIGSNPDFQKLQIAKCIGCGIVFTTPCPDTEYLSSIYSKKYREIRNETPSQMYLDNMKQRAESQRVFILSQFDLNFRNPYILDIGFGPGILLGMFANQSNNLFGFEPDKVMYTLAKERIGSNACLYNQMFDSKSIKKYKFDLIMASHILEHIPDPVRFLTDLLSLLTEKGLIFLEVPNDSLKSVYELTKYDVKGFMHLWFFQLESLINVINKAGGQVVRLTTYGPSTKTFSYVHLSQRGWHGRISWFMDRSLFKLSGGRIGLQSILQTQVDWKDAMSMENGTEGIWIRVLIVRGHSCR
ncbi:MAG: class I SAM-dependent methyltransferase [Candidatus Methanoperedens sp.]|nr:class I SAM-dependent methyltransferase [Candidatus Methanoperedens sp.]